MSTVAAISKNGIDTSRPICLDQRRITDRQREQLDRVVARFERLLILSMEQRRYGEFGLTAIFRAGEIEHTVAHESERVRMK